jgi:two-component sensor histidine kinase
VPPGYPGENTGTGVDRKPPHTPRRSGVRPPGARGLQRALALRTRQLRAVGEITAALATATELAPTLDVITRITSDVMGVASCSIYLLDARQDRIVLRATTGLAKAAIGVASLASGEGLTGWTIAHGRPLAARDARRDPRFHLLPETAEERLCSLLAVPLTVQGRTIGAMNVQTVAPHDFAADEVELLAVIANLAAGALEKAALHDRMQQQIRELEGLVTVSRTVTSPLYLDEVLGIVAEMAAHVMGTAAVALHLVEEPGGRLALRATHPARPAPPLAAPAGEPLVARVAKGARPLAVADLGRAAGAEERALAAAGAAAFLGVPLVVRDRVVGVLSCTAAAPHDFGPKEIDLFSMLASQTALAIENARLAFNATVVREMHHRVKNNLQTVAMLLRLQLGAAADERTRAILGDAMSRILSIAAVHETLSEQGLRQVDVRQVLERIGRSVVDMTPGTQLTLEVAGDPLSLPSRAATSLALAAAELMQNAVKHAFRGRPAGRVVVTVTAGAAEHTVTVSDDGGGAADAGAAPAGPARKGLGLEIVETLVASDLKGRFTLEHTAAGTRATIAFPATLNGESP